MSLTKEMILWVENQVKCLGDGELAIYYSTHKNLNVKHPNFFDKFKAQTSFKEIIERGLEITDDVP